MEGFILPFHPGDGSCSRNDCDCAWAFTTAWDDREQREVTLATWTLGDACATCLVCRRRTAEWQDVKLSEAPA